MTFLLSDERDGICITRELRKQIAGRDWNAVHIAGDRSEPLKLGDIRKRLWRR